MRVTIRTTYTVDAGGWRAEVEFVGVERVPGFGHRVLIDSRPVDWLKDEIRPSTKTAIYFAKKHKGQTR